MKYLLASLVAVGLIGGSPIASASGGLMQATYNNPDALTATEEDRKVNADSRSERQIFQRNNENRKRLRDSVDKESKRTPIGEGENCW